MYFCTQTAITLETKEIMTEITGNQMIESVQRLMKDEFSKAQILRRNRITAELDSFLREHNASNSKEQFELLLKALRRGDDKAIGQIRQLSASFENMGQQDLQSAILDLTKKLSAIDLRLHQIKTRSAFIHTVLRPFDPEALQRLLTGLPERQKEEISKKVEELRKFRVDDADYLYWVNRVADLFKDVVVVARVGALSRDERSLGRISSKSARVYYQTWTNHMKRIRRDLIKVADGKFLEQDLTAQVAKYLGIAEMQLANDRELYKLSGRPDAIFFDEKNDQLIGVNFARMTQNKLNGLTSPKPGPEENVAIEITIASKNSTDLKASKTWTSLISFEKSFRKWFSGLKLVWSEEKNFSVVITTIQISGKSEINFPIASLEFADEKIRQAVELQF